MRRFLTALAVMLVLLTLATGALAASQATGIQSSTTVSSDGSCTVNLSLSVHLDEAVAKPTFPLPGKARNVTVNTSRAKTTRNGELLEVDLSGFIGNLTGDYTLSIQYTLPGAVAKDSHNRLILTLPLLCSFAYPVQSMSFTVTLPGGELTAQPDFTSTYHQSQVESNLTWTVTGSQITGSLTKPLKDRDSLTMTLEVPEEMFPQKQTLAWTLNLDDIAMAVFSVLAVLYWIFFLRCLPPRRVRRTTPPEGFNAGQLGSVLTGQGTDLTMMVLNWAQLGYILIQMQDNGRVLLHKRMEMGNERSQFELHSFRALFGKRRMVDSSSYHYAQLCRKVAGQAPNTHDLFLPQSGNPRLFRLLAAGIGLFGGTSMGAAFAGDSGARWFLVILFALLGALGAWQIQNGAKSLHTRSRVPGIRALVISGLWIVLGFWSGEPNVAVSVVLSQLLAGLMAAYGGRRSELGKLTIAQILGLRRYLKTAPRGELQRLCRGNPEYFHAMIPYAMALGVDKAFARRFGASRLPRCPYLTTGMDGHMTAAEWCQLMRRAVESMDARQKQLAWERLLKR